MDTYLMSDGVTPASAKARGPDQVAPEEATSTLPPMVCFVAYPAPRTRTAGLRSARAISERVTTTAPPPSVITQQSSRCSGSAIRGDSTTSLTVTTFRSGACGLCCACWDAATLIQANCSLVVP